MEGSRTAGVALVVCALLATYGCGGGQGEFTGGGAGTTPGAGGTPTVTPGLGALQSATTVSSISFNAGSRVINLVLFDQFGNCFVNATTQIAVLAGDFRGHAVPGVP